MKRLILKISFLVLLLSSWNVAALTQTGKTLTVPHHKSEHVLLSGNAQRVSLGDPDVLDIVMLKSNELFLIGKKLGSTNLMVWDRNGQLMESINVEVTHDLNSLKQKIYEFMPNEKIEVHSAQDRLVLSGQVSSQEQMNKVLKIAETYTAGQAADKSKGSSDEQIANTGVVNLMSIGGAQQVTLEVSVAEVQRNLVRKFDANFNFLQLSGSKISWGATSIPNVGGVLPAPSTNDYGLLGAFADSNTIFEVALDIAKQNGMAKVLAEPNLTALSGSKAEFLAGGEFPIPVPDGDDGVTIEYKEYGVGLKFIPTILSDQKINLELVVDVSEISNSSSLVLNPSGTNGTYIIPPITRRSAASTLELADGQTIGIAGLLSENVRDNASKMPGFGDIPILGQLFNSEEFVKGETELVILVTPRLAKPIDRSKVTLPTDAFIEPNDLEFYILGMGARIQDRELEDSNTNNADNTEVASLGGSEGEFGHDL
ncbi:type II and III secretion system protein family protein [Vibrio litoralis]|uniref:type II and III secretion system protein family protein n=1 Tax=Vibrio litoralis TaxID=335972 RepID=UPI001865C2EA|nr:type II and III secretion system protein family protein [Vibrio litoralis]